MMDIGDNMRNRINAIASAVLLSLILLPIPASASGYVASKNSDVFHEPDCSYVSKIKESNKIWFDTIEEAHASGRRGCYVCNPEAGSTDITSIKNSSSTSKSTISANSSGGSVTSSTYQSGYDAGEKAGYESGQADMKSQMEATIESERKDASVTAFLWTLFLAVPITAFGSAFCVGRLRDKTEKQLEDQISSLKKELDSVKKEQAQEKDRASALLKKQCASFAKELDRVKTELELEKKRTSVYTVNPDGPAPFTLPPGVTLKTSYLPVKGTVLRHRPYGDFTVYTTGGGKKYHCKYNCCCATIPIHFFELPDTLEPCRNCVPGKMYPKALPDWYRKVIEASQGNPDPSNMLSSSDSAYAQMRIP